MPSLIRNALLTGVLLAAGCEDDTKQSSTPDAAGGTLTPPAQDAASMVSQLDAAGASASSEAGHTPDGAADAGDRVSDDTRVSLRFLAKLGAEDLACDRSFAGQGTSNTTVKVQDFRFFVSEVRLISASGSEVPLVLDESGQFQTRELALIDFTDAKGSCAAAGTAMNTIITGTVPRGEYTGIVFSTSVPEQLNHENPALAPAPLKAPGVAWDWLQGYRFVLAEVKYVASGADSGAAPTTTADAATPSDAGQLGAESRMGIVHIGSTGCLGGAGVTIKCDKPNRNQVRLDHFEATRNTIVADLGAIFAGVDLTVDTLCHGRGPDCAPMFTALGVDVATGAPLATQSAFRVQ